MALETNLVLIHTHTHGHRGKQSKRKFTARLIHHGTSQLSCIQSLTSFGSKCFIKWKQKSNRSKAKLEISAGRKGASPLQRWGKSSNVNALSVLTHGLGLKLQHQAATSPNKHTRKKKNLVENPPSRSSSSSEMTGFVTGLWHKKCLDFSIQTFWELKGTNATVGSSHVAPAGGQGSSQRWPSRSSEGLHRQDTAPRNNCPYLRNTTIEHSLKIPPCKKTKAFLQQKKTRAVSSLPKFSSRCARPFSQASPGTPASIGIRFLLAKHGKQKNRGFFFFQKSQRKDFSDTACCNQCRLSYCNTNRNSLSNHSEVLPNRGGKRRDWSSGSY